MYSIEHTANSRLTDGKLRGGDKSLQIAPICSGIHFEFNEHFGCYFIQSGMKITMLFPGLPTSFGYHLPPLFHTTKSLIHNHPRLVKAYLNQSD
jgi:hypothetical protein